jgi:threonine synthase
LIPEDATVVSVVTGNGLKDVASAQRAAAEAGPLGEPIHIPPELGLLIEEFKKRNINV